MPVEISENVIFLTGLSGSGKSLVGTALGRRLRRKLIDTDTLVARGEHMTVRALFERKGEEYFRRRERDTILALCAEFQKSGHKAVVSLGGGSLMNPAVANSVKKFGALIYLQIACGEAARRLLTSDTRPLILDEAGRRLSHTRLTNRLRKHLAQRLPGFRQAHYRVPVGGHSAHEICARIIELLG